MKSSLSWSSPFIHQSHVELLFLSFHSWGTTVLTTIHKYGAQKGLRKHLSLFLPFLFSAVAACLVGIEWVRKYWELVGILNALSSRPQAVYLLLLLLFLLPSFITIYTNYNTFFYNFLFFSFGGRFFFFLSLDFYNGKILS